MGSRGRFAARLWAQTLFANRMYELSQNKTLIEGKWYFDGSSMIADEACKRIHWPVKSQVKEIDVNADRWESLYQDPKDKR